MMRDASLKILLIGLDSSNATWIRELPKASFCDPFQLLCVGSPQEALEHLNEVPFDVLLAGLEPSDFQKIVGTISSAFPEVPIVIIARDSSVRDTASEIVNEIAAERDAMYEAEKEKWSRQAHKMEEIRTAAGNIAHGLSNTLGLILGYMQLILHDLHEKNEVRPHLIKAIEAGYRATDQVKQVLLLSRRTEQEGIPLQVSFFLKETLTWIEALLPTAIEIRKDITGTGSVMADHTQLNRVITNLCANACRSMREKGGILGIELKDVFLDEQSAVHHPNLKPGPFLKLTVSDTGCGTDPEITDRIFDLCSAAEPAEQGACLGLSVVCGIVQSLGGIIEAHSEPGKGSVFSLFLPAVEL